MALSVVALTSAIIGINTAFPIVEPYAFATHDWTRELIQPIKAVQVSQATSIDRFLLWQQQEALAKAQADPAAATSPIVQERIQQLKDQVSDTQKRITTDVAQPITR